MSFISNLLGGQQNTQDPSIKGFQGTQDQYNQAIANQNQNIAQLQTQAAGGGPSVATTMLNNAQQQNAASANAQAAGARGVNPGLALRQAIQSNAGANQQAQATGVAARQQEQLNAQQLLNGAVNTQAGQLLQGSQANAAIQAQAQNANANRSQSAAGGLAGGIASMFGLAEGGEIPDTPSVKLDSDTGGGKGEGGKGGGIGALAALLADGGYIPVAPTVNLQSSSGNPFVRPDNLKQTPPVTVVPPQGGNPTMPLVSSSGSVSNAQGPMTQQQAGPQSFIGKALKGIKDAPGKVVQGVEKAGKGISDEAGKTASDLQSMFASGGKIVRARVSPGELYLKPSEVKKVEKGEKSPMEAGEKIPGKPKVGGAVDSYANDTVYKKLQAGGVVIPRSVTMSPDAEKKAMAFMKALEAKRGSKK